jgi:LAS superfamily LD-carboxypeptidase LdcB
MGEPPAPPAPTAPTRRRRPPLWIPVLITVVLLPIAAFRLLSAGGADTPGATGGTNGAPSPSLSRSAGGAGSAPSSPGPTASATEQADVDGLPACSVGDQLTPDVDDNDWARTLRDTDLRLPREYVPPELVSVRQAGFGEANLLVRRIVVDDLADLREAAEDADDPIDIIAAYRSYAQQKALFDKRVRQFGLAKAYAHVAAAGHSEHQLGTTIDFAPPDADDVDQSFGETAAGRWLAENAYRFGFVQSYPKDESNVTCYGYEPWHFRYVGREEAERVHASGLTLRQFLWREAHS